MVVTVYQDVRSTNKPYWVDLPVALGMIKKGKYKSNELDECHVIKGEEN